MSKLQDAADALQTLEKLRQALRSPIGTVVAGVAHEVAQGSTLTAAINKHVHVKVADLKDYPVTIGDIIDTVVGPDEGNPVTLGEIIDSFFRPASQGGAPRPEADGAGEARSEETATMFPGHELAGKTQNSNR